MGISLDLWRTLRTLHRIFLFGRFTNRILMFILVEYHLANVEISNQEKTKMSPPKVVKTSGSSLPRPFFELSYLLGSCRSASI
jgi:hypothetical protein